MRNDMPSHIPVLLKEVLLAFADLKIETFLDATVGAGGHALSILENHPEITHFYGLDKDQEALTIAAQTLEPYKIKIDLIHAGFEQMGKLFLENTINAILLDIGVSSMQLDTGERGFSYQKNGPLDMRMDKTAPLDAATVINTYKKEELGRIFREYGEERHWKRLAKAIITARRKKKISDIEDLLKAIMPVLSPQGKRGRIHPATRIFQALRIEVNDELNVLKIGIETGFSLLKPKGRLAVISFHSLEDRIVKHSFRGFDGKILTKKPIEATLQEIKQNPRSRSAKLRVIEK